MTIWDALLNNFVGFLFVLCRVTGIFTFNPIFSRSNIPANIKAAMSIAFGAVMFTALGGDASVPEFKGVMGFVVVLLGELFIGFVFGLFTNLIITVLIYGGELIDMQVGLGMAKAMDPATGINMPIFGNLYYYLFVLYFFVTNGHQSYIKLFSITYETIPIGYNFTDKTIDLIYIIVMYMGTAMELAVKMALPILAASMITEVVVGIIMKAIPTIQVFVVNIQLKLIVGFIVIIASARPMAEFIEKLLGILWENLYTAAANFA